MRGLPDFTSRSESSALTSSLDKSPISWSCKYLDYIDVILHQGIMNINLVYPTPMCDSTVYVLGAFPSPVKNNSGYCKQLNKCNFASMYGKITIIFNRADVLMSIM